MSGASDPQAAFDAALAILDPPRPFALAVSGGPDSTALMRLAAPLGPAVFTVDHGLRKDSAAEAEAAGAWAKALGLKHEVLRWTGAKPQSGLQAAARAARYRLLAEACRRTGAATLMTGHTLDDQAETVAMRRAKGSGPVGLAGMASQSLLPGTAIRLVRPLIAVRKAALLAYLGALGQPYFSDPSNENPRFDRARLREAGGTDVDVAALAEAQRARLGLERAALGVLERTASVRGEAVFVPQAALAALTDEVLDVVLAALLRRAGGRAYPGTAAERARLGAAIRTADPFAGRTLAGAVVRPARRAEAGPGAAALAFAPEAPGGRILDGWWLPFALFPQIGPDGRAVTQT
ncbi:MAG: tRNA lysidine(34) synthetase TilS [Alphaproteobacteria bacterium]|nr:tRNA lysidine(34) synthetase TilS [Alphaproteobacteria bacterium]